MGMHLFCQWNEHGISSRCLDGYNPNGYFSLAITWACVNCFTLGRFCKFFNLRPTDLTKSAVI